MAYNDTEIISEITPLMETDCFYIVDRLKDGFNYPLHRHHEFELNFIEGCRGARRVVGDSIEELGDYDLVLIGHNMEHAWEQHECTNTRIREFTMQFSADLIPDSLLAKKQFADIREMLRQSSSGLAFSMSTILRVYDRLERLTHSNGDFYSVMDLFLLLHELAKDPSGYRRLSSESFSAAPPSTESRRVRKVQAFINEHYSEDLHLEDLASLVGMTPTSFSRFFKLRTGRKLSDYILDCRIGHATRLLVDTTMTIAEICYDCGFNNLTNFNRIFKARKNCTPKQFRIVYKRNKALI